MAAKQDWVDILSGSHAEVFTATGLTTRRPIIHDSPCFGEPDCSEGRTCCGIPGTNPNVRSLQSGFSRVNLEYLLKTGAVPCVHCFIVEIHLPHAG